MNLKYFNLNMGEDSLKELRNKYVRKHHPDRFTSEMEKKRNNIILSEINAEYDAVLKERKNPSNQPTDRPSAAEQDENIVNQAQNIFQALTNGKGVDYNLLTATLVKVKDYTTLFEIYKRKYGIDTMLHLKNSIKDKKTIQGIEEVIQISIAANNLGNTLNNIFRWRK